MLVRSAGAIRVQDGLPGCASLGKLGQGTNELLPRILDSVRVGLAGRAEVRAQIRPDLADSIPAMLPKEGAR